MAIVEAWFLGGPADGKLMPVEVDGNGSAPSTIKLTEAGYYLGTRDSPAQALDHIYILVDDLGSTRLYRYLAGRKK